MIELAAHHQCTGCSACAEVCGKKAIALVPDEEGFLMPRIDAARCASCGRCAKICPALQRVEPRRPFCVCVVRAKDESLRRASTSGGVFSVLARLVLADDGVVYGAALDTTDGVVRHRSAETEQELALLRGSKYVQSEVAHTYADAAMVLRKGRRVLYSGTPCQIAGLFAYLKALSGVDLSLLLTVEVICNSAPSPEIFAMWRDRKVRDAGGVLVSVNFRDKELGWRESLLRFTTTTTTTTILERSVYYNLWQHGYTVRPSCQNCAFRGLRSGADLTIGDAWGIETMGDAAAALDDGKGVSLVLANTATGVAALEGLVDACDRVEIDYETAVRTNPAIERTADYLHEAGPKRALFWQALQKSGDIFKVGEAFTRPPLKTRLRHLVGRLLRAGGLRK